VESVNSVASSGDPRRVRPGHLADTRIILVLVLSSIAPGCGNFMYKQEVVVHGDIVERKEVSCSRPHLLTRGCEDSELANTNVDLHGLAFRAAFSNDGSTILVMHEKVTGGTTVLTNMIFSGVRTELAAQGLSLQVVTAVQTRYYEGADVIVGYLLEVDGDSYAVLRPYFVDL
jgi:hypothetical protein